MTSAGAKLAPHTKLAATVLFVSAVVATRREAVWAFVVDAGLVALVAIMVCLPFSDLLRRLTIELPFVAFAVLLPFLGAGPRVAVGPLSLSRQGLWTGWSVVSKGTLGVAAAALLSCTTPTPEILWGAERLRAPRTLTAIAGHMLRYGEIVRAEAGRMRMARLSRGDDPRFLWQARAFAGGIATLFVRTFERGERVHLAMLSRGFDGTMPVDGRSGASGRDWLRALITPAAALIVCIASWVLR